MSRPNTGPSRPLGTSKSTQPQPQPGGAVPAQQPRRSAGALPGIARTASSLRQSSPANPSPLGSLPAHLRNLNLSTPKIPSPLGKGTPARTTKQSFPVRTSKTTERHVFLPEDPQLAPLPRSPMGSQITLGAPPRRDQSSSTSSYPGGSGSRRESLDRSYIGAGGSSTAGGGGYTAYDERSDAEKMTKREREESKLPRLTAYTTAEGYRLKLLQAFLKREHGVGVVRVFDDCVFAVYNLPLLPGYGASTQVRSAPAVKSPGGVSLLERMAEAEDLGYNDSYFPPSEAEQGISGINMNNHGHAHTHDHNPSEYILSHSPPSPLDLLTESNMGIPAGNIGERESDIEERQERLEVEDGLAGRDTLGLVQMDEEVSVKSVLERRLSEEGFSPPVHQDHPPPTIARSPHRESMIATGTHMSPEHPGHLEHIPSQALSPKELPETITHEHGTAIYATEEGEGDSPQSNSGTSSTMIDSGSQLDQHPQSQGHSVPGPRESRRTITLNDDPSNTYAQQHHNKFHNKGPHKALARRRKSYSTQGQVAEAVFFSYGVSVFFGFTESDEKMIMEDCERAGTWMRGQVEDDWEVEEFHYVYDSQAEYPRIYNDMFTFKSHSHLFKLSLSHAIAQSTKLSIYESTMQESLSLTSSFPKELSTTGHLQLGRRDALRMTGRLFKLRMDVNLIGGILDTPELFWSEASLYPLYEAIREYLEIGPRVQVLNDRLSVAGDLLEIIHEYIEERGTHRITWIIIWLIIIACLVEVGEVVARVVFHNLPRGEGEFVLVKGGRAVLGGLGVI